MFRCLPVYVVRVICVYLTALFINNVPDCSVDAGQIRDGEELSLRDHLESKGYTCIQLTRLNTGYLTTTVRVQTPVTFALRNFDKYFYAPEKVLAESQKPDYATLVLMLDTGAPNTYLDFQRTRVLNLKWATTGTPHDIAVAEEIQLGPVSSGKISVYSDDFSFTNTVLAEHGDLPVDGLLGCDVLAWSSAILDIANARLFVKSPDNRLRAPALLMRVPADRPFVSSNQSISAKRYSNRRVLFRRVRCRD